jgi:hypothetical protein
MQTVQQSVNRFLLASFNPYALPPRPAKAVPQAFPPPALPFPEARKSEILVIRFAIRKRFLISPKVHEGRRDIALASPLTAVSDGARGTD